MHENMVLPKGLSYNSITYVRHVAKSELFRLNNKEPFEIQSIRVSKLKMLCEHYGYFVLDLEKRNKRLDIEKQYIPKYPFKCVCGKMIKSPKDLDMHFHAEIKCDEKLKSNEIQKN